MEWIKSADKLPDERHGLRIILILDEKTKGVAVAYWRNGYFDVIASEPRFRSGSMWALPDLPES